MDCDQAQNLIAAQMADELPLDERASLDAHLNGCANCRATAEAWQREDAELRRAFAPRRAAATALAERVIAQVRSMSIAQKRPRQQWTMFLMPIASAAAGFLLAVFIVPQLMQPKVVERIVEKEKKNSADLPPKEETPPESKAVPEDQKKDGPNDVKKSAEDQDKGKTLAGKEISPDSMKKSPAPVDEKVQKIERPKSQAEVQLAIATGLVEARPEGEKDWQIIQPGSRVAYGTLVRTQKDARCEFHCPDGSEVRLNSDSEVVFLNDRELELKQGQVWSNTPFSKRKSEPLKIHTCDSVVCGEGAKFDLRCSTKEAMLSVLEGQTRIEGSDKKGTLSVGQGEVARIVSGDGSALQKAGVSDETTSWMDAILMRKGDSPEVDQRVRDALVQLGHAKVEKAAENEIRRWGENCVGPLNRYVQSNESRQQHANRVAAARILSDLAPAWAIGDLIELLRDPEPDIRVYAATALTRLTGQNLGFSLDHWRATGKEIPAKSIKEKNPIETGYEAWHKWWEQNKAKYPSRP